MKQVFVLAFALLSLQACQTKKESARNHGTVLDSVLNSHRDFSGVVLVADKGKSIYHKAFGYINRETKMPMDTTTLFELASVSKQFTAALILMLQEEGKLSVDDPLEKYVAGLPYKNITVRHLLNHTSGLPDYFKLLDEHWDKTKVATNDDIIAYLIQYHPDKLFEPGEKYMYSNTGYVMLGTIVEKASGKEFVEFMHERIFDPLKMSTSDLRSAEQKAAVENFALGYVYVPEKSRYVRADSFPSSNYTIWAGGRKGPGRISSTTTDLLKWDRALYTDNVLKKSSFDAAYTPAKLKNDSLSQYGFGWMLDSNPRFGKVVWHSGDNPGYKTAIVRYIDADKTVILLCNNPQNESFFKLLKDLGDGLR
jgi:CubicO group peptidase (beta-lactamase class C family)